MKCHTGLEWLPESRANRRGHVLSRLPHQPSRIGAVALARLRPFWQMAYIDILVHFSDPAFSLCTPFQNETSGVCRNMLGMRGAFSRLPQPENKIIDGRPKTP